MILATLTSDSAISFNRDVVNVLEPVSSAEAIDLIRNFFSEIKQI